MENDAFYEPFYDIIEAVVTSSYTSLSKYENNQVGLLLLLLSASGFSHQIPYHYHQRSFWLPGTFCTHFVDIIRRRGFLFAILYEVLFKNLRHPVVQRLECWHCKRFSHMTFWRLLSQSNLHAWIMLDVWHQSSNCVQGWRVGFGSGEKMNIMNVVVVCIAKLTNLSSHTTSYTPP